MRLEVVPVTLREATRFVADHHRHNEPPRGHRFSIGLEDGGVIVAVVIAGRPVARGADNGRTIELLRVTTLGDRNACSRLYGAACRAAAAMGYKLAMTYTLVDEPGTSLRAAGFHEAARVRGRVWIHTTGPRMAQLRTGSDVRMPIGDKIRWERSLTT